MHRTVTSWDEFKQAWDGVHNFLMADECVPFSFEMPPLEHVVEELRQNPETRISSGTKGAALNLSSIADEFRKLPLEQAMASRFSLAHFRLSQFDAPGQCLHGFEEQILRPWQEALRAQGFTWTRCYPILFASGAGCATNYHMDFSHVLAWQVYGVKRFCGLKDPNRWAPHDARVTYNAATFQMPPEITPDDSLCYEMRPGDALWNAFLTPHWVEASEQVALSVNISHGGLRLNGRLCLHEQELMDWREAHPGEAPQLPSGSY